MVGLGRGVGMGEVMRLGEQVVDGRVTVGIEVGYGERSVQVVFLIEGLLRGSVVGLGVLLAF